MKDYPIGDLGLYYLDEFFEPVKAKTLEEWSKHHSYPASLAEDVVGNTRVSTVFLGVDHGFHEEAPVLFETMIFGGEDDRKIWRYQTYKQAMAGHTDIVERFKVASDQA